MKNLIHTHQDYFDHIDDLDTISDDWEDDDLTQTIERFHPHHAADSYPDEE